MIEKEISKEIEKQVMTEVYIALIKALEKQIPYKPKPYHCFEGECKCGAVFLDRDTKYCGNCGQRLDWS